MDEYLQYLYTHIPEVRRNKTLLRTAEYHIQRTSMLMALRTMDLALSEEQRKVVDVYLSSQSRLDVLESDWLFLEGVALGRWLARQS